MLYRLKSIYVQAILFSNKNFLAIESFCDKYGLPFRIFNEEGIKCIIVNEETIICEGEYIVFNPDTKEVDSSSKKNFEKIYEIEEGALNEDNKYKNNKPWFTMGNDDLPF